MTTPTRPRRWWMRDYNGLELIAVGLYAICGAIIGLTAAVVYIGMATLTFLGAQWHWIW